jgi:capsular polysaccharide export protein
MSPAAGGIAGDGGQRSFLLLQGPLSPLYARIAGRLEAAGHRVCRINLCLGDSLHWGRRPGAVAYRGRLEAFPGFVAGLMDRHRVTDVVLHGECRSYHRIAGDEARRRGIRVFVTELGYLRPDWMTVDRDGTAGFSALPRDPAALQRIAAASPDVDLAPRYASHFSWVAVPDVIYNLTNTLLWFTHPHYRRHTIDWPPIEYAAWLWRLATQARRDKAANAVTTSLIAGQRPYFVYALQLEGDFQVRARSPFACQAEALEVVAASFRAAAPPETVLLLKTHPLDNGLRPWAPVVRRIAERHGLADRWRLVDGGRLGPMMASARGLVTINSSAGLEAVLAGLPTKVLAPAVYDVPGLTHTGDLDSFWVTPAQPDAVLAGVLVRALAGSVQARGTIYSREGLDAAVESMTEAILTDRPGRMTALGRGGPAATA